MTPYILLCATVAALLVARMVLDNRAEHRRVERSLRDCELTFRRVGWKRTWGDWRRHRCRFPLPWSWHCEDAKERLPVTRVGVGLSRRAAKRDLLRLAEHSRLASHEPCGHCRYVCIHWSYRWARWYCAECNTISSWSRWRDAMHGGGQKLRMCPPLPPRFDVGFGLIMVVIALLSLAGCDPESSGGRGRAPRSVTLRAEARTSHAPMTVGVELLDLNTSSALYRTNITTNDRMYTYVYYAKAGQHLRLTVEVKGASATDKVSCSASGVSKASAGPLTGGLHPICIAATS
jgi:hypothetical protein